MKERQIIFSGPMVRAILNGRKTQTRRIVRFPKWADATEDLEFSNAAPDDWIPSALCKATGCFANLPLQYGAPNDRLWVRETTRTNLIGSESMTTYIADGWSPRIRWDYSKRTRPAIHLPKKYARLWLEVTGVRVERLQDISEDDAIAEGVDAVPMADVPRQATWSCQQDYAQLWDKLNAKRAPWESNPWVWCIEFRWPHTYEGN